MTITEHKVYPEWRIEYSLVKCYQQLWPAFAVLLLMARKGGSGDFGRHVGHRLTWLETLSRIAANTHGRSAKGNFYKKSGRIFVELDVDRAIEVDEPDYIAKQIQLGQTDVIMFCDSRTSEPVVLETVQGMIKLKAPKAQAYAIAGKFPPLPPLTDLRRTLSATESNLWFKEITFEGNPDSYARKLMIRQAAAPSAGAVAIGVGAPFLLFASVCILLCLTGNVSLTSRSPAVQLVEIQKSHQWYPVQIPQFANATVSMSGYWSNEVMHYRFALEDTRNVFEKLINKSPAGHFLVIWQQSDKTTVASIQIPFSQMNPTKIDGKAFFVAEGTYPCSQKTYVSMWDVSDWIVSWSE